MWRCSHICSQNSNAEHEVDGETIGQGSRGIVGGGVGVVEFGVRICLEEESFDIFEEALL